MPLTDEQRQTVLAALSSSRRILRSDEALLPDFRESIAGLLEQFEAAILAMDAAVRKMQDLSDQFGRR